MITITSTTVNADGSVTIIGSGGPALSYTPRMAFVTGSTPTEQCADRTDSATLLSAGVYTHVTEKRFPSGTTQTITVIGPGENNTASVTVTIP